MSLPLCDPWKSSPFWHNGGWMCIIAFTAIYSRGKEAHPTPTLLPPSLIFFLWRKIWATCPRGTQSALIHSHLFSLAAISKASFYAQKWFVQAGPSKQLWLRPASLLWGEMTDNRGMVRGWKGTWLQFIWSENIFLSLASTQVTNHKQTGQIISLRFSFLTKTSYQSLSVAPFSPSWAQWLWATFGRGRAQHARRVTEHRGARQALMCSN